MNRYLLLLILLGSAVDCRVAAAQTCTASSAARPTVPTVRQEGLSELVSDIYVICSGGTVTKAGATIPAYDITVKFNAPVTSRIIGTDGVSSEALLLIDEPVPGTQPVTLGGFSYAPQFPCDKALGVCPGLGNGTGNLSGANYYGAGSGAGNNRNIFQGAMGAGSAKNTLVWKAVPFDPASSGDIRIMRLTNLRLDATSLPGGGDLQAISIAMVNSTNPAATIPVTSYSFPDGPIVVATATASLIATVRDAGSGQTSSGVTLPVGAPANLARVATLRFAGVFAGADKVRTGAAYSDENTSPAPLNQNDLTVSPTGTESGFYNASFGPYGTRWNLIATGVTAGLADSGTRYMAVMNHIPDGFKVYVDVYNSLGVAGPATARLINGNANGAGAFAAAPGTDNQGQVAQLTVIGGTAIAIWEVLRAQDVGTYDFGVYLTYPASSASTAPGPSDIQMMYAPTGGHATPPTPTIPVFDGTAASQNLFTYTLAAVSLPNPTPAPTPTPTGTPTGTPTTGGSTVTSTFQVSPPSMSFSGAVGGQNPLPQYLQISSTTTPTGFNISSGGTITFQPYPAEGVTYRLVPISVDLKGMAAGTYKDTLTVTNTIDGTVTPVAVTLTLTATPQILSLSVPAVQAGTPGFSLTVNGANFTDVNAIRWNGAVLSTTYVSATQLKALIAAPLIRSAGTAAITVTTADGAASNSVSLSIEKYTIASLSPDRAVAGDAGVTLSIAGSGFVPGMTVNFAGTVLPSSSVTSTQIVATVPASLIAQEGANPVSVSSPAGTVSNPLSFTVGPVFGIDTISPATVMVGGAAFTLNISGAGFASGSTVQVGTAEFHPDSLAVGQIVVTVPASLIARTGSLPVSVLRPGLPPSNGLTLTVSALPAITALDPPSVIAKSASLTLSVTGSGFLTGATVRWNAQSLSTTLVSSTQLTATVPAGLMASLGTALIDVSAGGAAFSNAVMIRINAPGPPTLDSISPGTIPMGAPVSITLSGTGFTPGCAVVFTPPSGATVRVVTDSCAPTQVVVRLPGSVLSAAGTAQVQVTNPDGLSSPWMPVTLALPPFPGLSFAAPLFVPSGQDQPLTLILNGTYPVAIQGTLTITFTPDGDLPDDPAIQFQNGSRVFGFTIPAGTQPQIQVTMKSGTVAGLITITPAFSANGQDLTPAGGVAQRIRIAAAEPSISLFTCTRTPTGFVAVVDGFTNTRTATQASFDLQSASGDSLGIAELGPDTPLLFDGWFGSAGAAAAGGVFRYTQTFTVDASGIASATVKLSNTIGTSTTASCQLH